MKRLMILILFSLHIPTCLNSMENDKNRFETVRLYTETGPKIAGNTSKKGVKITEVATLLRSANDTIEMGYDDGFEHWETYKERIRQKPVMRADEVKIYLQYIERLVAMSIQNNLLRNKQQESASN